MPSPDNGRQDWPRSTASTRAWQERRSLQVELNAAGFGHHDRSVVPDRRKHDDGNPVSRLRQRNCVEPPAVGFATRSSLRNPSRWCVQGPRVGHFVARGQAVDHQRMRLGQRHWRSGGARRNRAVSSGPGSSPEASVRSGSHVAQTGHHRPLVRGLGRLAEPAWPESHRGGVVGAPAR